MDSQKKEFSWKSVCLVKALTVLEKMINLGTISSEKLIDYGDDKRERGESFLPIKMHN
jgi:hypothetical protein